MQNQSLRFDRNINVGSRGISGHYATMMHNLRSYGPRAIQIFGIWLWVLSLPPGIVLYRFSPHVMLALILQLGLLIWTVRVWWQLLVAIWYAFRWAGLEMDGLQWTRRNDHDFRVTYYRVKDGSLKFDQSTRAQRLDQELQTKEFRQSALVREGGMLVAFTVVYLSLSTAYVFSYELMSPKVHQFLDRWNTIFYVEWAWFYLILVPLAVSVGLTIFEIFVHWSGAQFIPGAKLRDPVIPEKTLETLRGRSPYGGAEILDPNVAARRFRE